MLTGYGFEQVPAGYRVTRHTSTSISISVNHDLIVDQPPQFDCSSIAGTRWPA